LLYPSNMDSHIIERNVHRIATLIAPHLTSQGAFSFATRLEDEVLVEAASLANTDRKTLDAMTSEQIRNNPAIVKWYLIVMECFVLGLGDSSKSTSSFWNIVNGSNSTIQKNPAQPSPSSVTPVIPSKMLVDPSKFLKHFCPLGGWKSGEILLSQSTSKSKTILQQAMEWPSKDALKDCQELYLLYGGNSVSMRASKEAMDLSTEEHLSGLELEMDDGEDDESESDDMEIDGPRVPVLAAISAWGGPGRGRVRGAAGAAARRGAARARGSVPGRNKGALMLGLGGPGDHLGAAGAGGAPQPQGATTFSSMGTGVPFSAKQKRGGGGIGSRGGKGTRGAAAVAEVRGMFASQRADAAYSASSTAISAGAPTPSASTNFRQFQSWGSSSPTVSSMSASPSAAPAKVTLTLKVKPSPAGSVGAPTPVSTSQTDSPAS
jgi:hypothetical protein